jgi:hypothetical protein
MLSFGKLQSLSFKMKWPNWCKTTRFSVQSRQSPAVSTRLPMSKKWLKASKSKKSRLITRVSPNFSNGSKLH